MLRRSFKPAKCKTSLKLAASRMKLLRNKKDTQLKQLKREVSQLLESGKDRTARIRVEHVTREENTIAAYDLLEIYCELIVARLPIIESQKNCPLDLKEAIASVIFASPRCSDIPEFVDVKKHFTAKYGKEFVTAAIELRPDSGVSRMLIEKLSVKAPDGQTKMKILTAIAEEFNVKWDPESSGENELKPPEDLLNGPTTFAKASDMHPHTAVQSPPSNVQAPSSQDQKQYAPVDKDHNMSSTYANTDSFTSSHDGQTTTAGSNVSGFNPSGTESRKEVRQSYSGDVKDSSMGRQNWHMEFENATAAAHAAAESAERASMAARAAAEIASREKRQYSTEPHRSNIYTSNDGSREHAESKLPTTDSAKTYNSDNLDNVAHRSYRDGHDFQDLETSLDDEKIVEDKKEFFSGKSMKQQSSGSSADFVIGQQPDLQYEKTDYFGEESIRKPPRNDSSDSLPSDRGDDQDVPHSSFQKFGDDSFENPFVSADQGITMQAHSNDTAAVVFDESGSDEDIISFDTQHGDDRNHSKMYSPSQGRESSSHFSVNTDTWSPRKDITRSRHESLSVFNDSAERNSSPKFDENDATGSFDPSKPNEFSVAFDDSESHSSSDEELAPKRSDNLKGTSNMEKFPKEFDSDEVPNFPSLSRKSRSGIGLYRPLDEEKPQQSPRSSRSLPVNDLKYEEHPKVSSLDTMKDETSFHQSNLESELNFGTLTGGLRNKGYRPVPFARSSPTAVWSSSSENKADNIDDSGVGSSLKQDGTSPRVKDKWSSATPAAPNESDTDDSEEELPHNSYGKQKPYKAEANKEVNDKKSSSGLSRASSGMSRRTKGALSPQKASYSPTTGLKSPLSYEVDPVKKASGSRYESNTSSPKRESGSVKLGIWETSADGLSSKQPTSFLKSSTMEQPPPSSPLKKVPLASYGSPKASSVAAQEGPSRESSSSKSSHAPSISPVKKAPSKESSFGKASHVHPKLPDYDSIAALLQSRRTK